MVIFANAFLTMMIPEENSHPNDYCFYFPIDAFLIANFGLRSRKTFDQILIEFSGSDKTLDVAKGIIPPRIFLKRFHFVLSSGNY